MVSISEDAGTRHCQAGHDQDTLAAHIEPLRVLVAGSGGGLGTKALRQQVPKEHLTIAASFGACEQSLPAIRALASAFRSVPTALDWHANAEGIGGGSMKSGR
jgi:hypothetical protein